MSCGRDLLAIHHCGLQIVAYFGPVFAAFMHDKEV